MDREAVEGWTDLRKLAESYMVGVELGKHGDVSRLGFKICVKLIECFENELETFGYADYNADEISDSNKYIEVISDFIKTVCHLLRNQCDLAAAYDDVLEFVNIKDLACLSRMLGALPRRDKQFDDDESILNLDRLTQILRKSIYLLKSINPKQRQQRLNSNYQHNDWLNMTTNMQRVAGIGFVKYVIDFDQTGWRQPNSSKESDINKKLAELTDETMEYGGSFAALHSSWFKEFVDRSLRETYPMDRFSILVCIWQIAVECSHRPLEQLISQLVDQIAHEECNSLNEEELLSLTQIGSFWLSYYKRYETTTCLGNSLYDEVELDDFEDDDGDYEDDDDDEDDARSYSPRAHDASNKTVDQDIESAAELRMKLRRIIDDELLKGSPCLLCSHQPSEPLQVLTSGFACPRCQNTTSLRCSISYQPLNLVEFSAIAKQRPELAGVVVLSPSEWVRCAIAVNKQRNQPAREPVISERVDISERFERLVVIRGEESREDASDDSDTSLAALDNNRRRLSPTDYKGILADYMRQRSEKMSSKQVLSESLRLLRYNTRQSASSVGTWLPFCSSDVIIFETHSSSADIRLVSGKSLTNDSSRIWRCSAESRISKLPLGCKRTFSEPQLLRHRSRSADADLDTLNSVYICPLCGCRLGKIECLSGFTSNAKSTFQ